ncbi:hypothetical protein D3C85_1367770 [compost metagenome]
MPMPLGVPVSRMSPALSVMPKDSSLMRWATLKAIWAAEACCMRVPLSSSSRLTADRSTWSRGTIHGPRGMVPSMLLPLSHWPPWRRCRSRCDTSLARQ